MSSSLSKSDRYILCACTLALGVCIYFFYNGLDFFETHSDSGQQDIGKIVAVSADVRHKPKGNYFWIDVNNPKNVSLGDSIFTGPKSSSEVNFKDGRKLKLSQNSLVHFKENGQKLSVDLAFGRITSEGSKTPIVITDCGRSYTIDATDAQFELTKKVKCGEIAVRVKSGSLKINKKPVSSERVVIKAEGSPNQVHEPSKSKSDDNFTIVEDTSPVAAAEESDVIPEDLLPKNLHLEKEEAITAIPTQEEAQKALEESPPSEKAQASLELSVEKERVLISLEPLKLHWKTESKSEKFILEISRKEDFSKPLIIPVTGLQYDFTPKKVGTFFFRVKPDSPDNTNYSNVAQGQAEVPKLKLNEPKFKAEYKATKSEDQGTPKEFSSSWNTIPTAENYIVEVSESETFEKAKQMTTRTPASLIPVPKTGKYHYRVSAVDSEGRKLSSASGEIIYKKVLILAAPIIEKAFQKINFFFQKDYGQFIWLRWLKPEGSENSRFRLQISQDANFKQIQTDSVLLEPKYLLKGKMTQGQYYWRVRVEEGQQTSDWSPTNSIKIQTKAN